MKNNITFGRWEGTMILINSICAKILLNYPRPFIESAGTAAWIQVIFASFLIFIYFFLVEKLFKKFEGMDIIDISEYLAGSFGRIFVGITITFTLVFTCFVVLREYTEDMKIISLVVSPISYVTMFFLVGMIAASYVGLEGLARLHAVSVPVIAVISSFLVVAVFPLIDTSNFFPLLGNGIDKITGGGFIRTTFYGPIIYLFLIYPFLKNHSNFRVTGYLGLGVSMFYIILWTIAYSGIIPYPTSTEYFIPSFQLARLINYGRFFERVETFFMLSWAMSGLLYLSIVFYFITYCFKKAFKLAYQRPLILPFAVVIFSLSLLPPNLVTSIKLETDYYPYIILSVIYLQIPIVLAISNIKKRRQAGGEKLSG